MPITQEVFIEAHPGGSASVFVAIQSIINRILKLPALNKMHPFARKVQAVTEPVGRLSVRWHPSFTRHSTNEPITVISANLWHDWPKHRHLTQRLESFAAMVKTERADVVLLQEVSHLSNFHVEHWLSEHLGMAFVYSRANGHESSLGFEEGLAVLSRFPIQNLYLQQLGASSNIFVHRLAMGAKVLSPAGPFAAFSVHLGLFKRQNANQINHLYTWLNSITGSLPAIIGGDFNTHENSPHISRIRSIWLDTFRLLHPRADGTTHEMRTPWGKVFRRSRLDYIFLHPGKARWKILETRHLDGIKGPHSDHRAVLTRLVLNSKLAY